MRKLVAILAVCLPAATMAAESAGERVKADAKAVAHGVKDAAVDVGRQVGAGSKKAYKSTKAKIKGDVQAGRPGDGSHAARNERQRNAKDGRE